MTDRPIIFSAPMVVALLQGRKTMTRRILKPEPRLDRFASEQLEDFELRGFEVVEHPDGRHLVYRPAWRAGDRLWVREVVAAGACCDLPPSQWASSFWRREQGSPANRNGLWYAADGLSPDHPITDRGRWRPSIHMPRWASRLTLAVGKVCVERLHDITEEAANAEGVCHFVEQHSSSASWDGLSREDRAGLVRQNYGSSLKALQHLWGNLHGTEAWAVNPWVAVISFAVTHADSNSTEQA